MTNAKAEALTIEQDEIRTAMHNMKNNAHMYSSGTELFRQLRKMEIRYQEIQNILDN